MKNGRQIQRGRDGERADQSGHGGRRDCRDQRGGPALAGHHSADPGQRVSRLHGRQRGAENRASQGGLERGAGGKTKHQRAAKAR